MFVLYFVLATRCFWKFAFAIYYWMVGLSGFMTTSYMKIKSKELFVCCDVCQESSVGTLEISLLGRAFLTDEKYHSIVHYKWLTLLYVREIKRFASSSRVYKNNKGHPALFLEYCYMIQPKNYVMDSNLRSNCYRAEK